MAEITINFSTVIQCLIVVLFKYQFDFEMNLSTFAFLKYIFENCKMDEKQKVDNFFKTFFLLSRVPFRVYLNPPTQILLSDQT